MMELARHDSQRQGYFYYMNAVICVFLYRMKKLLHYFQYTYSILSSAEQSFWLAFAKDT